MSTSARDGGQLPEPAAPYPEDLLPVYDPLLQEHGPSGDGEPLLHRELEKYGVPRERVTYIPNFVSKERFYPLAPEEKAALRRKYGLPEDRFLVFCAGQLQKRKGFFDYIELALRMPDVRFVWAGSFAFGLISEGHDEIKRILEHPPENFTLLGLIDRDRMNEVYNLADLMLLPSFEELFR